MNILKTYQNNTSQKLKKEVLTFQDGQKQRLTIARALIKKPKILILDDSVSALDSTTEQNLRNALNEEFENTTIFLITQRINSCKTADKILVMDEPFVGLDPKAVFDVKKILNEMVKDGKTVFFSTHILDVAEKLCSRVAIIKKGELIKVGNMKEIKGDKSLEKVFLDLEGE